MKVNSSNLRLSLFASFNDVYEKATLRTSLRSNIVKRFRSCIDRVTNEGCAKPLDFFQSGNRPSDANVLQRFTSEGISIGNYLLNVSLSKECEKLRGWLACTFYVCVRDSNMLEEDYFLLCCLNEILQMQCSMIILTQKVNHPNLCRGSKYKN